MHITSQQKNIASVSAKFPYTTLMSWEFFKHKHPFFEIIVCISGKSYQYINEQRYDFSPGDIIIMNPGSIHDYKIIPTDEGYSHYDFYPNGEDIKKVCDRFSVGFYGKIIARTEPITLHVTNKTLSFLEEKLQSLNSFQQNQQYLHISKTIYLTILDLIFGLCFENFQARQSEIPDWLNTVLSAMSNKEYIACDVSEIAKMSGFSHPHLSRLFKEHTGETLVSYFTKIKMDYANILLKNKDLSMLDISTILGYDSLSYFINLYKKYSGLTPKQHQKALTELT